jgi:hypothetical protein
VLLTLERRVGRRPGSGSSSNKFGNVVRTVGEGRFEVDAIEAGGCSEVSRDIGSISSRGTTYQGEELRLPWHVECDEARGEEGCCCYGLSTLSLVIIPVKREWVNGGGWWSLIDYVI